MKEDVLIAYDREGKICNRGDILYDKHGYQYSFIGVEYIIPQSLFQRLISVGKAGNKAVLRLRPSEKNNNSDTIYVELEWTKKLYSHNRFDNKKP